MQGFSPQQRQSGCPPPFPPLPTRLPCTATPLRCPKSGHERYLATLPRVAVPLLYPKTGRGRVSRYPPLPHSDPRMPHTGAAKGIGIPSGGSRRGSIGSRAPSDGSRAPFRGSLTPFSGGAQGKGSCRQSGGGAMGGSAGRGAGCSDTAPVGRRAPAGVPSGGAAGVFLDDARATGRVGVLQGIQALALAVALHVTVALQRGHQHVAAEGGDGVVEARDELLQA